MRLRLRLILASAGILSILMTGCATTEESDIPWNAPANWEGSPYVPGLSE